MTEPQHVYVFVEGHGEVEAVSNLLWKLSVATAPQLVWRPPLRWTNLHQWRPARRGGVESAAEYARRQADVGGVLLLRDADDDCLAEQAPRVAEQLRRLALPFPVAFVLMKPEYEVLFLPCLDQMSSAGMPAGLSWDHPDDWEARRGVKEWLSAQLPRGRRYKPTTDQLRMTRLLDHDVLARAGVPCFDTLRRAVDFLGVSRDGAGQVYPPPSAHGPAR